jgi:hypothetical protein
MRFPENGHLVEVEARQLVGVNEGNAYFAAGLVGVGVMQTFAFPARTAVDRGELIPLLARLQPPE